MLVIVIIGTAGWSTFQYLFFDSDGQLYAVKEDASFYRAPPPTYAQDSDNWSAQATKIGSEGWNTFKFLFY